MEKRVIKKDALAGIIKNIAENTVVYAPVRDEDNILFKAMEKGMEPFLDFDNTKNAPKNFFFPQTEVMMRYMRTERGQELSTMEGTVEEAVLFGVRPCDAKSFVTISNAGKRPPSSRLPVFILPIPPVSAPPWMDIPCLQRAPMCA